MWTRQDSRLTGAVHLVANMFLASHISWQGLRTPRVLPNLWSTYDSLNFRALLT
jgi:hypothetical protein